MPMKEYWNDWNAYAKNLWNTEVPSFSLSV